MASLYITVWDSAASVVHGPPLQEMVVTVGAGSLDSAAITSDPDGRTNTTKIVRLFTDTDCFVTWGTAPTALADGTAGRAMGTENPEYFSINTGNIIAVIARA